MKRVKRLFLIFVFSAAIFCPAVFTGGITADAAAGTVSFYEEDGATLIESVPAPYGYITPERIPAPAYKEGWNFTGWIIMSAEADNGTAFSPPYTVGADVTLNVKAAYAATSCVVTITVPTLPDQIENVPYNGDVSAILAGIEDTLPEIEGRYFAGWSHSGQNITGDITIAAMYYYNVFTVIFMDSDGATPLLTVPGVATGESVIPPSIGLVTPVTGADCVGWDADLENIAGEGAQLIVMPKMQKKIFKVTFIDGGDGIVIAVLPVEYGGTVPEPKAYKAGYTFTGWDKPLSGITEDTIITASYMFGEADAVVDIAAVPLTIPVYMAVAETTVETAQYTGIVTWGEPLNSGKFTPETVYTATIELTAKTGYTLTGAPNNFFTVSGAESVTSTGGTIAAVFFETGTDAAIAAEVLTGVITPVYGGTPSTSINPGTNFTASLTWNGDPAAFGYYTQYTATITLTAEAGYTFIGFTAANIGGFTVDGVAPAFVSNDGTALVITVTFPYTAKEQTGGEEEKPKPEDNDKPKGLSTGAVAGIAAGGVGLLGLAGLIIFILKRKKEIKA